MIHKFCELQYEMTDDEDWTTNLKFFKLLKGKNKLYDQDQMWKECCKQLPGWKFIKSLT